MLKLSNLTKKHIDYVVEDNMLKVGKFLPNGIPIKSLNDISKNSQKVILVLAWNFAEDIIKKLQQKNIKADIIIPLPLVRRFTI